MADKRGKANRRPGLARPSLQDLRRLYVERAQPLPRAVEAQLRADPRKGAQAILLAVAKRRRRNRSAGGRLRALLERERALWRAGLMRVAGVDEAGMSPLAGPVAAAAVIFAPDVHIAGVDDSKLLDADQRTRLSMDIKRQALAWSVAFAHPLEIDAMNIYWAGLLAMERAVAALSPGPQHLLIDGRCLRGIDVAQERVVGGDRRCFCIAAASILAKTARDEVMATMDQRFPGYGFARHKGYPVPEHLEALRRLGPSPIHRRSFAPVKALVIGAEDRTSP